MFTSNFKTCWDHPNAVAISIGLPRGRSWKGKRYLALAPTREMLKMPSKDYDRLYREILSKLDPQKVANDLSPDAIMLCFEKFNEKCHRRLVAEYLETSLGIVIPEFGYRRDESLPYEQMGLKKLR